MHAHMGFYVVNNFIKLLLQESQKLSKLIWAQTHHAAK